MYKKEKMQKYLQRDFELMFILYLIKTFFMLFGSFNILVLLISVAVLVILGFGIHSAKNGQISAGIYGVVVGALMFTGDDLSLLLGIFILIHSLIYLVNYNKLK